jgi:hypothetical protein
VAHTHKLEVVGQRIAGLITANKSTLLYDDLWYGDQDKIPTARTICVEPVVVNRTLAGAPDMVENNFSVALMVYIVRIGEVQALRSECNALAEAIEDVLHLHLDLDDNVHTPNSDIIIHGFVDENLSGYSVKQGRLIRSSRLSWSGKSKTSLRFGP